jgi:hypothetical protein
MSIVLIYNHNGQICLMGLQGLQKIVPLFRESQLTESSENPPAFGDRRVWQLARLDW